MQVIVVQRNIPYAPAPNEARIILSDQLPPLELITSAFAFVFDKNRFVMTHLVSRGWDVPGGHREPGEAPIETAKRELLEEAGAEAEHLKLLGYQEIRIDAPKPEGYPHPYPPELPGVLLRARGAALSVCRNQGDVWPGPLWAGRGDADRMGQEQQRVV